MVETHIPTLPTDQDPAIQSLLAYPSSTPHLNRFNLVIRDPGQNRGRGIYTTTPLSSDTLIEISPVLLFPPAEYQQHGSKTQLDGYTFVWKRTDAGAIMALALGLGSLFNHSERPNVKWVLDKQGHCIRYVTVRRVEEGEELTISYGTGRMWWEGEMSVQDKEREEEERRRREDVGEEARMMGLIGLDDDDDESVSDDEPSKQREGKEVVNGIENHPTPGPSRTFPPIYRLTAAIDPVTLPLNTRDAWMIDIPPTSASLAVKFLQKNPSVLQNRDDGLHSTRHLRSFRTTLTTHPDGTKTSQTQFLLCLQSALPDRSALIEWLTRESEGIFGPTPQPYLGKVPTIAAPTKERLPEWQAVWPCIVRTNAKELLPGATGPVLLVDRKRDEEAWQGERLRWAVNRFKRVIALARSRDAGGVASAVHVTHPFETARGFIACDGGVSWEEREHCDWSKLTGKNAPLVGRIHPRQKGDEEEEHLEMQKQTLLNTFTMTEEEWASFNSTPRTQSIYTTTSADTIEIDALDQRIHRRNPLKHALIEAIARVSTLRTLDRSLPPHPQSTPTNGNDYLLTNLALFSLYEPCIYCTMALVHSRVSEIYFLLPSPGKGGCCGTLLRDKQCHGGDGGGLVALQEQKGLNHQFTVWRWMADTLGVKAGEGEKVHELMDEFHIGLLDP